MSLPFPDGTPLVEYRRVRATVADLTRLTPLAFDRHVRRGYFPPPLRLPGRCWRWYTPENVVLILDLCRRRRWTKP
jgi:predicted DNA-binding transcriptional regulator AlpA